MDFPLSFSFPTAWNVPLDPSNEEAFVIVGIDMMDLVPSAHRTKTLLSPLLSTKKKRIRGSSRLSTCVILFLSLIVSYFMCKFYLEKNEFRCKELCFGALDTPPLCLWYAIFSQSPATGFSSTLPFLCESPNFPTASSFSFEFQLASPPTRH